jgi:mRNA interferase RelE/StbE
MALYKITFKPSVAKDLKRLDHSMIPKIMNAIEALGKDPFPTSSKKLVGSDCTYRIRIGDYRVVYIVSRKLREIEVQRVRHRKDVYL